jgi:hypothetical protein
MMITIHKKPTQQLVFLGLCLLGLFSCQSEPPQQSAKEEIQEGEYIEKGNTIAAASFQALSGELKKALVEGGIKNAVSYCNVAALPLLDSLSKVHAATIKRTSFKVRNPKDAPTAEEAKVLQLFQDKMEDAVPIKPLVQKNAAGIAYYSPILVNDLCLKCHGQPGSTMTAEDYAFIKEKYPADEAIGYVSGDLRGMWSIQFSPQE